MRKSEHIHSFIFNIYDVYDVYVFKYVYVRVGMCKGVYVPMRSEVLESPWHRSCREL